MSLIVYVCICFSLITYLIYCRVVLRICICGVHFLHSTNIPGIFFTAMLFYTLKMCFQTERWVLFARHENEEACLMIWLRNRSWIYPAVDIYSVETPQRWGVKRCGGIASLISKNAVIKRQAMLHVRLCLLCLRGNSRHLLIQLTLINTVEP